MTKNTKCKKCDSNKIIQNVKIIDYGHSNIKRNLSIEIDEKKGFFNKKSVTSEIVANICGNCGSMEFYTLDYEKLWNIYNESK